MNTGSFKAVSLSALPKRAEQVSRVLSAINSYFLRGGVRCEVSGVRCRRLAERLKISTDIRKQFYVKRWKLDVLTICQPKVANPSAST